jgi:hypothetical protein
VITTRRKSGTTHRQRGNHSFTKPQIARRNNAGLSTDNRNLTQMFRDELGHLEHTHLALAIKYRRSESSALIMVLFFLSGNHAS